MESTLTLGDFTEPFEDDAQRGAAERGRAGPGDQQSMAG
jgi:hypothetical protein